MKFNNKKKADEIFSLFGSLGVMDQKVVLTELNNNFNDHQGKGGTMDIMI